MLPNHPGRSQRGALFPSNVHHLPTLHFHYLAIQTRMALAPRFAHA
jgi:hypothetical protein